jgi:flagellar basal-body rod modification protein FlgD
MSEINNLGIPKNLMMEDQSIPKAAKNVMGKDDFMRLLMTQLRNQDPLNPMDHKEMATNLAQFGSLEQLQNIGTGIQGMKNSFNDGRKMDVLNYIGKKVQATGNEVNLMEGQAVRLQYMTKDGVQPVKADIIDPNGKPIREMMLNGKTDGSSIEWDGKDSNGQAVPAGKYTFRVIGVDNKGQGVDLSTEMSGKVTGVDMQGETPLLIVQTEKGKVRLEMSRIRSIDSFDDKPEKVAGMPTQRPMAMQMPMNAEVAEVAEPPEPPEVPESGDDGDERPLHGFPEVGGFYR